MAADALVRRVLAALVVEDPDAPANFSLQLHPPQERRGAVEPLHRLYDGHTEVARDRRPARVLRALVGYLSRFVPPDVDTLRLNAIAVRGSGGAVLVPAAWRRRAPALERHLRRAGLSLIDAPHAWLDVRTGEVLAPAVRVDPMVAGVVQAAAVPRRIGPVPPSAPYRLRGWVLPPAPLPEGPTRSRAAALVTAMGLARDLEVVGGGRALQVLADGLCRIELVTAPPELSDARATALVADLLTRA